MFLTSPSQPEKKLINNKNAQNESKSATIIVFAIKIYASKKLKVNKNNMKNNAKEGFKPTTLKLCFIVFIIVIMPL